MVREVSMGAVLERNGYLHVNYVSLRPARASGPMGIQIRGDRR